MSQVLDYTLKITHNYSAYSTTYVSRATPL
ncbi:UNVERIFIED_CONTAM: hypothetical protein GTU68_031563 [Idotea baltica]|nr:hypothetical protein [Idotea baltica]